MEGRERGGQGGPGDDSPWERREGAARAPSTSVRSKAERGREARGATLSRPCRAVQRGATLPHQDLRRGSACHVSR